MIDDNNKYVYFFLYSSQPLLRFWEQVIYEIV